MTPERLAEHKKKIYVRINLRKAVNAGRVTKEPCVVCGDPKSEAHHPDYSKPYEVKWLCFKHHRELHKGEIVL